MAPFFMVKNKLTSQFLTVVIYIVSFYVSYILTPQTIESIWLKILICLIYTSHDPDDIQLEDLVAHIIIKKK